MAAVVACLGRKTVAIMGAGSLDRPAAARDDTRGKSCVSECRDRALRRGDEFLLTILPIVRLTFLEPLERERHPAVACFLAFSLSNPDDVILLTTIA